jgi:hypothetical protein
MFKFGCMCFLFLDALFFLMFILIYSQDFRQLIRGLREILISAARFTIFWGEIPWVPMPQEA